MTQVSRTTVATCLLLTLAACSSSYHSVTDPSSGITYYTNDLEMNQDGSVRFTDNATSKRVTLRSSKVREIDRDTYQAGTAAD